MKINELKSTLTSNRKRKRVGRGSGSGLGKTAGRGVKGQKSRSGVAINGFEGGQMPLYRRLPKRGFTNIFRKKYDIVNISQLASLNVGSPITPEIMKEKGLVRTIDSVKILGNGELSGAVIVHAQKFSRSAMEKIEKSGGKAVIIR